MDETPGGVVAPDRRRRERLRRSIAQAQLLTSAAMLVLAVAAFVVTPTALQSPLFFNALALLFVLTCVAVLVPWTSTTARFAIVLPILNMVAIVMAREGQPNLGAGLFLVFPVIWMARHNGLGGAIGSVAFATTLLWVTTARGPDGIDPTDFGALALLPITLAFISTSTFVTARRTVSQRILLQQQAALVESAFARARRQEQFRDEVLNSVSFGVLAFDRHGSLTLMNEAHRRSLDEFDAPAGAAVHETVYQADRVTPHTAESRPLSLALAGVSFDDRIIWVGAPGERRAAFAVTSRALADTAGDYDGQVIVVRDVTRELEAIAARDDLVASVSHELRTPITSILGYLELVLDEDEVDEQVRSMVGIAYRNSERLLSLVADLTHASSGSDSVPPMTFQPCDLSYTVTEAVEAQRPAITGRGLRLETQITEPCQTVADPLRMRQVLDNLLTNAIKYNRDGGLVSVTLTDDGTHVEVCVRDTGVGMSAADQTRLFERFYRTDSARASSVHGSGLGLAISRDIVELHGGEMIVTSALGSGTTIRARLPSLERPPTRSEPPENTIDTDPTRGSTS